MAHNFTNGVRVYNDANQTITDEVESYPTFNSERYDTEGMHSTSSNTERITIQTAGRYYIGASIIWGANSTGRRFIAIDHSRDSGSTWTDIVADNRDPIASLGTGINLSTIYDCEAGDLLKLRVLQDSGSNLTITSADYYSPEFFAQKVGEKVHRPSYFDLDKSSATTVLDLTGTYYAWDPSVVKVGSTYYMAYSRWPVASGIGGWATDCEVALATSSTPTGTFTHSKVLITAGSGGSWDDTSIHNPKFLLDGSTYRIYYLGIDSGGTRGVGVASSSTINGTYTKSGNNPLIENGGALDWDKTMGGNPAPLKMNNTYFVYYKGFVTDANDQQIGLATAASFDGPFTKYASNPIITIAGSEDPHVWYEGGMFRIAFHDWKNTYSDTIWMWSHDGYNWLRPPQGYAASTDENWGASVTRSERVSVYQEQAGGALSEKKYAYAGLYTGSGVFYIGAMEFNK